MPFRLFVLLLILSQSLTAQQFNFTNIGTDKGLPSSEVYFVMEDSRGYIWCATNNGVSCYNGKQFTTYTTAQGLTDNTVFRMCEDHKGRIWFAPQNNELCYWQNDSIHLASVTNILPKAMGTTNSHIKCLYADSSNNLWIKTSGGHLFMSESKTEYSDVKKINAEENCHVEIKIIDGKKAINTWQWSKEKNNKESLNDLLIAYPIPQGISFAQFKNALSFVQPYEGCAVYMNDGHLFYACNDYLFSVSRDGKIEIKKFDKQIISLYSDANNGLWIGFIKGGLEYYKNKNLNSKPLHFLEQYSVSNICQDHEGAIWVSTLERGVFYMPSLSILVYTNIPALEDHIISIAVFNDKIIASTYGGKIVEANKLNNISFSELENSKKLSKTDLLYSLRVLDDKVYACFSNGLVTMDKSLHNPEGILIKGMPLMLKDVVQAEDHSAWGLIGGGIKDFRKEMPYNAPFRVTCAIAEEKSALYVGGKKGLYLFDKGIYSSLSDIHPLLKSQIIDMKKDSKGNLWIATVGAGILILKDNKVTQLTKKNGLISDICSTIEIDTYGNVWVGTPQGLSCIKHTITTENKYTIKNITKNNGLNSNEITKLCAYQNNLWVGTMSGLSSVNISEITRPVALSPTFIHSIKINNIVADTNQRNLAYDKNNFKFLIEGLTYSSGTDYHYHYRLIGSDSVWQETTTDEIGFNNLSPGNYTFQAAVANTDGMWSKLPASYSFTIEKPFWLRWWFILIEIGCLAFAIYLFIRFRERIITKREEEKTRISKLLAEYQMKALQAQMNPHFIFNAMNSIQSFILQNDSSQAYDYLTKFSKLVRFVLVSTKENEMTLKQEIDILELYVELEQLRFENAFEFILQIDKKLDAELVMIPTLLIQPYVENAIWHGLMPLKERKGILQLSIGVENEMLKIKVSDNGLGRERSQLIRKKLSHKSMGMDINQKRVELFGEGNKEAQIVITDLFDSAGEPNGTCVEITLPLIENY